MDDPATSGESDDLELAREIARSGAVASLATLDGEKGPPHASLVTYALSPDCRPVFLLSQLARHTQNLLADPQAALLIAADAADSAEDPLSGDRVTLRGTVGTTEDPADRARFLRRHPAAVAYAEFGDFGFFRMTVRSVHLVGGFGRIRTFDGDGWLPGTNGMAALIGAEAEIASHMNDDHADAVAAYATGLLGKRPGAWRMTGIDPWGADLRLGGQTARLPFGTPVTTPEEARQALVAFVRKARAAS